MNGKDVKLLIKKKMKVSIIIPNWFAGKNGKVIPAGDEALWFAERCFERVKRFTQNIDYELILIDNGSIHGQDLLKKYADKYIHFDENQGFARGCNAGFEQAIGEYIVCMNNDIFVWDNWLVQIIEDYESLDDVGVLMPALVKTTKNGVEADKLTIDEIGLGVNKGKFGIGAEFGSLWLIKKTFFDLLKEKTKSDKNPEGYYFDPTFFPGFGEDRDLWRRVRLAGKETYRTHNVRVFHQGNVSMGKFPNRKIYTKANREYLDRKYKE